MLVKITLLALNVLMLLVVKCGAVENLTEPDYVRRIISIRLPNINIQNASAMEAFRFVALEVLRLDPVPEPAMRGISFFTEGQILSREQTEPYVRKDIEVGLLLQDLADIYNVGIYITDAGIIMTSPQTPPFPNLKAETGQTFRTYIAERR